jgi:hypothetical protein
MPHFVRSPSAGKGSTNACWGRFASMCKTSLSKAKSLKQDTQQLHNHSKHVYCRLDTTRHGCNNVSMYCTVCALSFCQLERLCYCFLATNSHSKTALFVSAPLACFAYSPPCSQTGSASPAGHGSKAQWMLSWATPNLLL